MMKNLRWSFIVIAIMITIVKPTLPKRCTTTSCSRYPRCPTGYNYIRTKHDCLTRKLKKYYCCRPEPQCVVTDCATKPSCKQHYKALERTKNGCDGTVRAYCCKITNLPLCFAMDCPNKRVNTNSCPAGYNETGRYVDKCGAHGGERVACCKSHFHNWNDGNETLLYDVPLSNADYFTIHFNNSQLLYAQFYTILLTLPIFTTFFKCISLW